MKRLLANLIAMAIICVVIFMLEHAVFCAALQQQRLQRERNSHPARSIFFCLSPRGSGSSAYQGLS